MHVRHAEVRRSGAILGTCAGTAAIAVGLAASANTELVVAALLVRGIWWWTIGKLWVETDAMPRALGYLTMGFAILAIVTAIASPPLSLDGSQIWTLERLILGVWSLALAIALWRVK